MMRRLTLAVMTATALVAMGGPKVTWLSTTHNFGAFDEDDGPVTCEFKFVNTGDEPLVVISARTSCGCTTSKPPRDEVMPGDTAAVTATYDPKGRPGRFEKRIYVDTNTTPSRSNLTVKGVVIGSANTLRSRYPVEAGPLKLRNTVVAFGQLKKSTSKSEFFEVYNASADTIRPRWEDLPPYLSTLSVVPWVAPGEQMSFTMFFDTYKNNIYGIVNDTITLIPAPGADSVKVSIVGMVNEDFSNLTPKQIANAPHARLSTDSLDFGSIDGDEPLTRQFTVTNRGKDTLILRRVYSTDPGISVAVDTQKVKKGASATVTVTVDPRMMPAELLNARISVIANDPDNPVQSVRAVGIKD